MCREPAPPVSPRRNSRAPNGTRSPSNSQRNSYQVRTITTLLCIVKKDSVIATFPIVGLVGLGLAFAPLSASAEYRALCDSSRVCEYTGPNAPVLDTDVCLDPTGEVRLKGSSPCSTGSIPFHVRFGDVIDPVMQLVVAYIPLKNACSVPGMCEVQEYSAGTSTAQAICCINGVAGRASTTAEEP